MKKIFALCLFILVLTFSLSAQADAASPDDLSEYGADSVGIDVITELGLTDGDVVFKLYNCPVLFAFGKSAPIDEVVKSSYIYETFYAVLKKGSAADEWKFYTKANGSLIKVTDTSINSIKTALVFLNNDDQVKEFSGAKTVTNKFFFFNPTMQQGNAIYYQTEKGDFVYYDLSGTGRKLFTAEEFYAIAVNKYSEMRGNTRQGGTGAQPAVTTGPETNDGGNNSIVWIIAAVSAVIAAAAVTVTLVLKKRKA